MAKQRHFMSKDDGPIIQVRLNEWPKYRRDGYIFRTEIDFNAQSPEAKAEADKADEPDKANKKKAKKKKVMRKT